MSFQTPITLREAISNIDNKKYFLPAIQREFVWDDDQIERLFDSLMRGYPIGAFLFWEVNSTNKKAFQFYEFIRDYHERDRRHNVPANVSGEREIIAILDGQQRLTSLYVGLKGTYADKLPRYRWDNPSAFPQRKLYVNLLTKSKNGDLEYDFQFLTAEEALNRNEEVYWFEVGKILDLHEQHEVNSYLLDNDLMSNQTPEAKERGKFANKTLFKLHEVVHKVPAINYYLEKDESLDKVLNVFIRVNSGGTPLSYSDLLLSIATAEWTGQERNARQIITDFVEELNRFGSGFNFTKDLILKASLVLNDIPDIAFKVDNFKQGNMAIIEKNWTIVTDSLRLAVELITNFGYSRETLTSNNAVIPIAYYLKQIGSPKNFVQSSDYKRHRELIQKWITRSLLKQVFAGASDTFLTSIRRILLGTKDEFPLDRIAENFKGTNKSIIFSDEEIEHLFSYEYGKSYTFSALVLLYPSLDFRNKFHQDHIFPKSIFKRRELSNRGVTGEAIDNYIARFNYLANLQLLEGIPNQEKSDKDFKTWLHENYPDDIDRREYMNKHYIPNTTDLSLTSFEEFISGRTQLMIKRFASELK